MASPLSASQLPTVTSSLPITGSVLGFPRSPVGFPARLRRAFPPFHANLAYPPRVIEGLQCLLDGCLGIEGVRQVQVERFDEMLTRESPVVGMFPHRLVDFGGDDHLLAVAAPLHLTPNDLLCLSPLVTWEPARGEIRRIEEIAAALHERIHHSECRQFVGSPAPLHGAETEAGDLQTGTAKSTIVHMNWSLLSLATRRTYPSDHHHRCHRRNQCNQFVARHLACLLAQKPLPEENDR
jgi:hypothetical protein